MSVLGRIFDFIKGLFTRPGLNTFLKKYQSEAIKVIENLAQVHSGQGLNEWWDQAFAEVKAMVTADGKNIADNWISIALNLAYEVFKAEQGGHNDQPEPQQLTAAPPVPDGVLKVDV